VVVKFGENVMDNKFKLLISNKKFLSGLKFWVVGAMIAIFGFTTQIMINKSMIEYVLVCGGLLIFDMCAFKLIDLKIELLILDEILNANNKSRLGLKQLSYQFNSLVEGEREIHRLAAKYERCWTLLKNGCEMSNNTALAKYLDELEKTVEPEVNEALDKIYEEKKN
jgi:hypothetical protein